MNNDQLDIIIKAQNMAKGELDTLSGQIDGLESKSNLATKAFGLMSIATLAIAGTAVAFGLSSVKAFNESAAAMAQTDAVLKSTGSAAGVTRDEVLKLSTALEGNSRYAHENVQSAENMLLTFTNISSKVFPATTQAVLDMSTAMGTDLKSTAIQVGKALQDPVLGATALQRVGVRLSATQKESIKHFVAVGDAASAQGVILKELQTEFGGSAAAAGNTFAGQLDKLKNTLTNVQEGIGEVIAKGLTPAIASFMVWFDSIGGVEGALKKLTDIFTPIFDGIVSISKQVGDYLMPKFEALSKTISVNVLPVLENLWKNVILPFIPVLGTTLVVAIGAVVDGLTGIVDGISWVVNAINTGNPVVLGLIAAFGILAGVMAFNAVFDALTVGFSTLRLITIPSVVASFDTIAASSAGLAIKMIADFVKMSVSAVVEAAKATVAWVTSGVQSAAAWVSDAVPKIIAAFSLTAIKSYIHAADVALAWTINAARVSFVWVTQELPKIIVGFVKVTASATFQAALTSAEWIASSSKAAFAWTVTQLPKIIAGFIATSASAIAQAAIVSAAWIASSSTSAIAWVVTALPKIIAAFVVTSGAAIAQAAIATIAWVASAVTSTESFVAFRLLVSTPMVMPAIAVAAAVAAIALVYNAIQSVIGAMNALNGLSGAKNNAISNAQSTIDNAKKEYDAGTINKTQYDKINAIGNSAKSSAQKIDTSFGAQLGGWWNDLGFASGGYTGAGGLDDVAGVVHKGEYVLPQSQVDQSTGKPKANGSTTNNSNTTTIQNVYLGSGDAVTAFFNKLDQDNILVGKGLSPNRGAY